MFKVNYKNNKKGVKYVQGWGVGGGGGGGFLFLIYFSTFSSVFIVTLRK